LIVNKKSKLERNIIIGESFEIFSMERFQNDWKINEIQLKSSLNFLYKNNNYLYLSRANSNQIGFNDEELIKKVKLLNISIIENNIGAEHIICKNDFIIFLKIESSLIYFCIKNKIDFNIVVNPDIYKLLSLNGCKYYDILFNSGVLVQDKINRKINFNSLNNIYRSNLNISDIL
jgi:hypothetical protein